MSSSTLNILHLSDLHFNSDLQIEMNEVLEGLIQDIEQNYSKAIDILLITGDIAFRANEKEYELAKLWIDDLVKRGNIDKSNILIVPGNHDIQWTKLSENSRLEYKSQDEISKMLSNSDSADHKRLFSKFENYNSFVQKLDVQPDTDKPFRIKQISKSDRTISFYCLNSAWFSGENKIGDKIHDGKQLYLGKRQIDEAFQHHDENHINITLMHHPFDWLNEEDEYINKNKIVRKSHFILHGHVHYNSTEKIKSPDSDTIIISAGASYAHNYLKLYNIIEINLVEKKYNILFRRYSQEGRFWTKDNLTYKDIDGEYSDYFSFQSISTNQKPEQSTNREIVNINTEIQNDFARRYYRKIINDSTIDRSQLLKFRKSFYSSKKEQAPKINDIGLIFIYYAIEKLLIRSTSELEDILFGASIISELIHQEKKDELIETYTSSYFREKIEDLVLESNDDLKNLSKREYAYEKQKEIEKNVEGRIRNKNEEILGVKLKKIEEEKMKLEQEYDKLEQVYDEYYSIIDKYLVDESLDTPQIEPSFLQEENRPWFEVLGLNKDPFFSHIGLDGFKEDSYDDIVVKTKIFTTFVRLLTHANAENLKSSYLIYGVLGTGKTTLYRYLQKLISINVDKSISFYIPLEALKDSDKIRSNFYQKIYDELTEQIYNGLSFEYKILRKTLEDSTIRYLMDIVKRELKIERIFLFIDDLHKNPKNLDSVFDFISGLQIFRSYLSEKGHNVTIFLTGDPSWETYSGESRRIGGAIDSKYTIDQISIENAMEMINNRLSFFAFNKSNPPIVNIEYMNTLFTMVQTRRKGIITFRDIIEEVESHWQNYEFNELKLSSLDSNVISQIALDIDNDHKMFKNFLDDLVVSYDKQVNIINQFMNILSKLFVEGPIKESSEYFQQFVNYFIYLGRNKIVVKVKNNENIFWKLDRSSHKIFTKFQHKYGFMPREYLSRLALVEDIEIEYSSEESQRMSMILKEWTVYGLSFTSTLETCLKEYQLVFKYTQSKDSDFDAKEIVSTCIDSIVNILNCLFIVAFGQEEKEEELEKLVDNQNVHWLDISDIENFRDTVYKLSLKERDFIHDDAHIVCRDYTRAIKQSVSLLSKLIQFNTIIDFTKSFLNIDSKRYLHEIRRNYYNQNFDLALKKIKTLISNKFKKLIYIVNIFLFGTQKWKRGIPESISKIITIQVQNETELRDVLNCINFTDVLDYLATLDGTHQIIFKSIFGTDIWGDLFENFVDLSQKLYKSNNINSITDGATLLLDYLRDSKKIIEKIDSIYISLLNNEIPTFFNYRKFNINHGAEKKFYKIDQLNDVNNKILEFIKNKESIELNLNHFFPYIEDKEFNIFDWICFIFYYTNIKTELNYIFESNNKMIINI